MPDSSFQFTPVANCILKLKKELNFHPSSLSTSQPNQSLSLCILFFTHHPMFLLFLFLVFPGVEPCHPEDQAALLAFKNSFSVPNPFPSWDPTIVYNCCNWYGVTCNETTNFVTELAIIGDINGTIPSAVSGLKHLESLYFHKVPSLVGEIPLTISKLSKLRSLSITWTNISGPVPDFLSRLKNLAFLDLSFNNLSGPIPASLTTLPYLDIIDLSRNQLTGPIPESFGQFPITSEPPQLILSHNKLSGPIPASLKDVNFFQIDISNNNLSGDASVLFGKDKIAYNIVISRNNFEFNFSKVVFSKALCFLDISHNRVYGSIPTQITDSNCLQLLNVSYNRLCGEIPTGWGGHWDSSVFIHNKCLCGTPLDPCK